MSSEPFPSSSSPSYSTCYFDYIPVETPGIPLTSFSQVIYSDTLNPLLALRSLDCLYSPIMDASKLLQLQTAAAHPQVTRPIAQPLQQPGGSLSTTSSISSGSTSSSSSEKSTTPPPILCCARCRRNSEGHSNFVKFGTNLFYCSHCASITGYNAAPVG